MNIMMMALLQDRLWQMAASLECRLDQPEAAQAELAQVLRALQLLDEGLYGVCDVCRDRIEPDVLLVGPHRLVCPRCQCAEQPRQKSPGEGVGAGIGIGLPVHPQACAERAPAFVVGRA